MNTIKLIITVMCSYSVSAVEAEVKKLNDGFKLSYDTQPALLMKIDELNERSMNQRLRGQIKGFLFAKFGLDAMAREFCIGRYNNVIIDGFCSNTDKISHYICVRRINDGIFYDVFINENSGNVKINYASIIINEKLSNINQVEPMLEMKFEDPRGNK